MDKNDFPSKFQVGDRVLIKIHQDKENYVIPDKGIIEKVEVNRYAGHFYQVRYGEGENDYLNLVYRHIELDREYYRDLKIKDILNGSNLC